LIQTAGRAARHLNGEVILYGRRDDAKHPEISRRHQISRERQIAYNVAPQHHARSVVRAVEESLAT